MFISSVLVRFTLVMAMTLVALFYAVLPVYGQDNAAISVGYQSQDQEIVSGAIVSLTEDNKNAVELATPEGVERIVGVVDDNSLIELSSNTKQVQVATSGKVLTLVSDINGDIKAGDRITVSPSAGVGMKAGESTQIVGAALADLSSVVTQQRSITDRDGKKQSFRVGLLPVQINISYFTVAEEQKSYLPKFLQEVANGIAGREVSAIRVVISLLILLMGFFGAGMILYAAVRSSMISLGRNPLSGGAINRGLLQVGGVSVAILLVMLGAVYLILTI